MNIYIYAYISTHQTNPVIGFPLGLVSVLRGTMLSEYKSESFNVPSAEHVISPFSSRTH